MSGDGGRKNYAAMSRASAVMAVALLLTVPWVSRWALAAKLGWEAAVFLVMAVIFAIAADPS